MLARNSSCITIHKILKNRTGGMGKIAKYTQKKSSITILIPDKIEF